MNVTYDGPSDTRSFNSKDFQKADLEHKAITFKMGEVTEVSDEVGQALTAKTGLFSTDKFSEVKAEEPKAEEGEPELDLGVEDPKTDTKGKKSK